MSKLKATIKIVLKVLGVLLTLPIAIVTLLAVLLYVPPVQDWAVQKAAAVASEQTGMAVSVDKLRLRFPLNLAVMGVKVEQTDSTNGSRLTLIDARQVVAGVRLLPLMAGRVEVEALDLRKVRLNTARLIASAHVEGNVGRLTVNGCDISLGSETVSIGEVTLDKAVIGVALNDTVPEDTASSPSAWRIEARRVALNGSRVTLSLPGDTLRIGLDTGRLVAGDILADLGAPVYSVGSLLWQDGGCSYDNTAQASVEGLDYSHINMSHISLCLDSLLHSNEQTRVDVSDCAFVERSGLAVKSLSFPLRMDTVGISISRLLLYTAASDIEASLYMPHTAFDSIPSGRMTAALKASLGRSDLMLLLGNLPRATKDMWPMAPLTADLQLEGNVGDMTIRQFTAAMPSAFRLKAVGTLANVADMSRLKASVNLDADIYDIGFVSPMMPDGVAGTVRLPVGMGVVAKATADGPRYTAGVTLTHGKGVVRADASVDMAVSAYKARVDMNGFNLSHFVKGLPDSPVTASLSAQGRGFDVLSPRAMLDARAVVDEMSYGGYGLGGMKLTASVSRGVGQAVLDSRSPIVNGIIDVRTLMDKKRLGARIVCDILDADFQKLGISENPFNVSLNADVQFASDLAQSHTARGAIANIVLKDSAKVYRLERMFLDTFTRPDSTHASVSCGDLDLRLDAQGSLDDVLSSFDDVNAEIKRQSHERIIDQMAIRSRLPQMSLYFDAGRDNVLSRAIRHFGYEFKDVFVDISTSPTAGMNGRVSVDSLLASGVLLDTIRMDVISDTATTRIEGQIANNRYNPQFVFNSRFRAAFYRQALYVGTRVYDDRERLGLALGLKASMEQNGVRLSLGGIDPVLGYKTFKVSKGNYIFFDADRRISADMRLRADDGMGVSIYSADSTYSPLDLTLGLTRFDLAKVLSVIPYAPNVSGLLSGDFHVLKTDDEELSVSSSVSVSDMKYEGCHIGDVSSEFVYMPRDAGTDHCVDGTLSIDGSEVCTLNGKYETESDSIDADLVLDGTPLLLLDGFVPDRLLYFKGKADGKLCVRGTVGSPMVNGEIVFDAASIGSEPYGVEMRLCDDPVTVTDSRLRLENFEMYATNGSPLNLYGYVDFSSLDRLNMDIKMRANNYLLIDSKENARSEAYGKAYVNFYGMADGLLESLRFRGRLDVLGSTALTYILRDSPLTSDNRLEGLVTFVNFRNPESAKSSKPPIAGLNMDLTVNIDEAARVTCALNADHSNYVDITGGGSLRMQYTEVDGLQLAGRYTIDEGEMKYSLPVIPLKTFHIQDGSYMEFTGDPMNPRLNITALEKNKATVSTDGGQGRSVTFDCGVVITKTLQDMGLQFVVDAPDDQAVHNELMTMSMENRGKIAVTMLTTGMYIADGNTSSFNMNSALNAFLNSQINAISGSALRTLDLSFGVDNTVLGSGNAHTDYSFKFSKRLWNNRLRIVVGGKVSSGAEMEGQDDTFFDNVVFEYRLSSVSNQYMKLFYTRDSYDWLEGYVGQYGGGFMWRRKLQHFKDIFRFKADKTTIPMANGAKAVPESKTKKDSIAVDNK